MKPLLQYALASLVSATLLPPVLRADPLAKTPPMGWNSWDAYGFTIDEAAFKANARALAGFRRFGWQYVVIDEGWYMRNPAGANRESREYQMDGNGLLMPAKSRFPSAQQGFGLKPLADWVHAQGLKLGIHIVRGIPRQAVTDNLPIAGSSFHAVDAGDTGETCPWDDGNYGIRPNEAGQAYYDSMFKLYAAWTIDFVKVDCIASHPYRPTEIRQIATAIKRAGRPMVLSLSPGPTDPVNAAEVAQYAQLWRISNDIWDGWSFKHSAPGEDFPAGVESAFDNLARWSSHTGDGHWPDADMLPFGSLAPHPGWGEARQSRLTPAEQQTQFVLWAIARSPLILGANLTRLDEQTRSLIVHRGLIALNQGSWSSHPVATLPAGLEQIRVWRASKSSPRRGRQVIALFNLGPENKQVSLPLNVLGVSDARRVVTDVLSGARLGEQAAIGANLAPHACAVYAID
jgi:alpha-galactosidase